MTAAAVAEPAAPRKPRARKPKVEQPAPPPPPARKPRARKPKVEQPVTPVTPTEPETLLTLVPPADEPVAPPAEIVPASPVDLSEDKEREDFARLEGIVRTGFRAFYEVGLALAEIRERRLYRHDGFLTFEEYTETKWHLASRQRAQQYIEASWVVKALEGFYGDATPPVALPHVESHARGLLPLLERPEKLAEAWEKVVNTAQTKHGLPHITGTHVEEVVREVQGLTKNPGTGPGEKEPTPPTRPTQVPAQPPVIVRPEDNEPPAVVAPPIGQEPDPIEGGPTEISVTEIEVLTKGEKVVLTPQVALEKMIVSLKLGEFSHRDPQIVSYLEAINEAIGEWFNGETDSVTVDETHLRRFNEEGA